MSRWPTPRIVALDHGVAGALARIFGLGQVQDVALAARGWVSLNVTWRLLTSSGAWALKEVTREARDHLEAAAAIELAASRLGVAAPRIVRAETGSVTAVIDGRVFRCHEFVDGDRPGDDLRRRDAVSVGEALGRIHAPALTFDPRLMTQVVFGEDHWKALIERGERAAATWTGALIAALPGILRAEDEAAAWRSIPHRWIGSHRDIRPDNALRVGEQIVLVDWDGAGPVVQGREVAGALRWWRPHDDAFLDAYRGVIGDVDLSEGSGEDGGLVWWLETNVQHALQPPGDQEREWAVGALAANFIPAGL